MTAMLRRDAIEVSRDLNLAVGIPATVRRSRFPRRPRPNVATVMHIIGDVEGRPCVIVDDLVDTANTLFEAAGALKDRGAERVLAYCTHPVLSGKAVERIAGSVLDEVVVTDTIPLTPEARTCKKIRVLTVAGLLAETMRRISNEDSVSSLFVE